MDVLVKFDIDAITLPDDPDELWIEGVSETDPYLGDSAFASIVAKSFPSWEFVREGHQHSADAIEANMQETGRDCECPLGGTHHFWIMRGTGLETAQQAQARFNRNARRSEQRRLARQAG